MIDRIDRIVIPIVAAAILTLGIAVEAQPESIPGIASPVQSDYFQQTHNAPAIPTKPMPLPEWATDFPTSPNGAPIIYFHVWEVHYADGVILWQDEDGNVYWDMHPRTYHS